jgi:hypothetical protein
MAGFVIFGHQMSLAVMFWGKNRLKSENVQMGVISKSIRGFAGPPAMAKLAGATRTLSGPGWRGRLA